MRLSIEYNQMWDRRSLFGTCQHFVTLNPCTVLKAKREDETTFPNLSHAIQLCRGRACSEGIMLFEGMATSLSSNTQEQYDLKCDLPRAC
jgi:hypothetical protein